MAKIKIRKWEFITILESIRDEIGLNTIDEIINDINRTVKNDDDYVLQFNDLKTHYVSNSKNDNKE